MPKRRITGGLIGVVFKTVAVALPGARSCLPAGVGVLLVLPIWLLVHGGPERVELHVYITMLVVAVRCGAGRNHARNRV